MTRRRTTAASLFLALLVGVGPGIAVQPCPKHGSGHGHGAEPAELGSSHAHATRVSTGVSDGDRHGPGGGGGPLHHGAGPLHHGPGSTDESHESSSGEPCDCLGLCLSCCGPELVEPDDLLESETSSIETRGPRFVSRVAGVPAPYLHPLAQPPPSQLST